MLDVYNEFRLFQIPKKKFRQIDGVTRFVSEIEWAEQSERAFEATKQAILYRYTIIDMKQNFR